MGKFPAQLTHSKFDYVTHDAGYSGVCGGSIDPSPCPSGIQAG